MKCSVCWLLVIGFNVTFFGSALLALFPVVYDHIFESLMKVYPGSFSYEIWHELPIPMYMKVYYFNVTNADDVENNVTVIPQLQELGPYVFKEMHLKVNERFEEGTGNKATFQQIKTWEFLPEESDGDLDDMVTNIAMVPLAAAEYSRHRDAFYINSVNGFLNDNNATMFTTASVRNLTFDGTLDAVMEAANDPGLNNIGIPIPFDRFGWFYPRNGSADYDGDFTMYTGMETLDNIGQIYAWKNSTTIDPTVYPFHCGELTGSAGEFFPPNRDKTYVDYFVPDLCRSIRFNYKKTTKVSGIRAFEYALDESLVANVTAEPENFCFNPLPDPFLHLPNGLLNVSTCKFDAPAYVSFPHFYLADPALLAQFPEGTLNPNEEQHGNHLSLMPDTGIPLEVEIRMQINALVRPIKKAVEGLPVEYEIEIYRDRTPTYYPMIWFETSTAVDDSLTGQLNLLEMLTPLELGIGISSILVGVILFALGGFMGCRDRNRKKQLKSHL